jgi:hypothetical protein
LFNFGTKGNPEDSASFLVKTVAGLTPGRRGSAKDILRESGPCDLDLSEYSLEVRGVVAVDRVGRDCEVYETVCEGPGGKLVGRGLGIGPRRL